MSDQPYSWFTVEPCEDRWVLYLNNKKGVHKVITSGSYEFCEKAKARREAFNAKISAALAEAVRKIQADPSLLAKLRKGDKE